MLDLNKYQALVFAKLKELEIEVEVYDKIPANAKFPFIVLSDFTISDDLIKDYECLAIEQKLEIWSDYAGKKEINRILHDVYESITELHGIEIENNKVFDSIYLMPSTVQEVEGFFNANLFVKFEIL